MAAGAASSAASAAMTKKGTPGQMGFDYITPKSVGESSPTGQLQSDYFRKALEGFATGSPYTNWGDWEYMQKRKLQRGQKEAMYGSTGDRSGSATGMMMEAGGLTGLGGGRTQASMRPLANQWLAGSQAIEEYLASQKQNAMQQREGLMMQTGSSLSQPYQGQAIPYMNPGTAPQTSPWAGIIGGALGGIANGIGQGTTSPATTSGNMNYLRTLGMQTPYTYSSGGGLTDRFSAMQNEAFSSFGSNSPIGQYPWGK